MPHLWASNLVALLTHTLLSAIETSRGHVVQRIIFFSPMQNNSIPGPPQTLSSGGIESSSSAAGAVLSATLAMVRLRICFLCRARALSSLHAGTAANAHQSIAASGLLHLMISTLNVIMMSTLDAGLDDRYAPHIKNTITSMYLAGVSSDVLVFNHPRIQI